MNSSMGTEKAGPETTRGVIERLRNEAKGTPKITTFRMEVERLFPADEPNCKGSSNTNIGGGMGEKLKETRPG